MKTIERELDFYRQQYNELGSRFLRLQEKQIHVEREARRNRMLAVLIQKAYDIANSDVSMEEICQQFLQVVLGTLNADRATILVYLPEQESFLVQYSLGFSEEMLSGLTAKDLKGESHFVNPDSESNPLVDLLRQAAGVPYLLWAFNPRSGVALLIGSTTEDHHLQRPFEESDRELIEGALNIFIDIIERKQGAEALKQAKNAAEAANRAKSDFLANMSHELRTPLNHIIGFTELVVDKHFGELNDIQEEYLNDVLQSSRHLLSLINDILDLSKVEAGKLELHPTHVNLEELVHNSLILIKERAMKQGIQLTTDIQSIPESIVADERKLKQILYNLVSNAVKFTPQGGSICVSASRVTGAEDQHLQDVQSETRSAHPESENFVKIAVSDTGIGLKKEDLARIFDPFEQVESSANRRYQGTGLGLSLTKKLVELHGGKLWAESPGEGKGSTFTFMIPTHIND